MQTPAPPSLAPLNAQGQMSARVVHAIHAAILRGRSFRTAAMAQHVSHDLNEWRRRAALGDDPFWPWAVAMVEGAQAEAAGQVEEAHRAVALTGTLPATGENASPSAVRAQENFLKAASGSDLYTDPASHAHGATGGGGGAGVTIHNILMYLGAQGPGTAGPGVPPAGALGALVDRAWGGVAPARGAVLEGVVSGDVDVPPAKSPARVSFKPATQP